MAQEIFEIFTHMHIVGIIALVFAMVLLILELILTGFGVCGLVSCFFFVVACVTRLIQGTTTIQTIVVIVIMVVAVVSVAMFTIRAKRNGTFHNLIINDDVAVPEDYDDPYRIYGELIGKEGTLLTQCKPVGKANIEDNTYEVYAVNNGYITRGANIKVVDVEGDIIFVERI